MSPDDIRSLRQELTLTQRSLADALKLDVAQVRRWETGEEFPTKANCEAMEGLRKNPPVKVPKKGATPMQVLADPKFFALVRKLIAHPKLRAEVDKLSAEYPDPLDGPQT